MSSLIPQCRCSVASTASTISRRRISITSTSSSSCTRRIQQQQYRRQPQQQQVFGRGTTYQSLSVSALSLNVGLVKIQHGLSKIKTTVTTKSSFSTLASRLKVDPALLVTGLTLDKVKESDEIAQYLYANFPLAFVEDDDDDFFGKKAKKKKKDVVEQATRTDDNDVPFFMNNDQPTTIVKDMYGRDEEIFPLNIRPLYAYKRPPKLEQGQRRCYQIRRFQKMIPGILYGGNPTLQINSYDPTSKLLLKTSKHVLQSELDRYDHNGFQGRVYDLTIFDQTEEHDDDEEIDFSSGTVHRVTPQNVQIHPVRGTGSTYCCNYLRYYPGKPLKVPIKYINEDESIALRREGFIVPIQRSVEVVVDDGANIPECIEVECAELEYRDVIRRDRLILPDGVHFTKRLQKKIDTKDYIIGIVFGKGKGTLEAEAYQAELAAQEAADEAADKK